MDRCRSCGRVIPDRSGVTGRRPLYCGKACRVTYATHGGQCAECGGPCGRRCARCRSCALAYRRAHPTPRSLKACTQCGTWFDPGPTNRRSCSVECREARRHHVDTRHERPVLTCVGCGRSFVRKVLRPHGKRDYHKYCSRACAFADPQWRLRKGEAIAAAARARAARTQRQARPPKPRPLCQVCGAPCPSHRRIVCSAACGRGRQHNRRRERMNVQPSLMLRTCLGCGVPMPGADDRRWGRVPRVYCSRRCARRMRKYTHLWAGMPRDQQGEMIRLAATMKAANRVLDAINKGFEVEAMRREVPDLLDLGRRASELVRHREGHT